MHEGDGLGPARADRLAGRRRGGDHRPRLLLAGHVGARLHVCHVSTAGSVEILRWAKARGVAGHRRGHAAPPAAHRRRCAASYDPVFKVNPPLRTDADVEALRAGLADGTIDAVATDHAPHAVEDKESEWGAARPGMLGLEQALVGRRRDDGRDRAARLARRRRPDVRAPRRDRPAGRARPAARGRRAGQPGAGRPGRAPRRRPGALASRSRNTPYAGRELPAGWSRRSCAAGRPCSTGPWSSGATTGVGPRDAGLLDPGRSAGLAVLGCSWPHAARLARAAARQADLPPLPARAGRPGRSLPPRRRSTSARRRPGTWLDRVAAHGLSDRASRRRRPCTRTGCVLDARRRSRRCVVPGRAVTAARVDGRSPARSSAPAGSSS